MQLSVSASPHGRATCAHVGGFDPKAREGSRERGAGVEGLLTVLPSISTCFVATGSSVLVGRAC